MRNRFKYVCQLDNEGYFLDTVMADPDPLDSDGWLLPGGCVDVDPPSYKEGYKALYSEEGWVFVPIPPVPVKQYKERITIFLNRVAQHYGYESILDAVSYADDKISEKYYREGWAFKNWRSRVWQHYENLVEQSVEMTEREWIDSLPQLEI